MLNTIQPFPPKTNPINRRRMLATSIRYGGLSLPGFLALRAKAGFDPTMATARSCIILYCWGGMSHFETWDPKPGAPAEIRGEFQPIQTATSGMMVGEHMPKLAEHSNKLAIVRSMHHNDSAHGRGMYWNLTGHQPPRAGNIPPMREDWPSLPAMISQFRNAPSGVPRAVRLPYPMVDNGTLQAGEYGGWLGARFDPIVMRPPGGEPYGGVSRTLGSEVLELKNVDRDRVAARARLLSSLEATNSRRSDYEGFDHFHDMARDILLGSGVRDAYDLNKENPQVRRSYGSHLAGNSMLLARRLTEAGVPVVQVLCSAGDLNGGDGDMWDTHGDNFNRLKHRLLPVFDHAMSALLQDLDQRGTLEETLVVVLTDFGRTPRINSGAGRDHYPHVYSIAFAGGGTEGGQVYGSSDENGAFPGTHACGPPDVHATIFQMLGISPRAELTDLLGRPFPVSDGKVLPIVRA